MGNELQTRVEQLERLVRDAAEGTQDDFQAMLSLIEKVRNSANVQEAIKHVAQYRLSFRVKVMNGATLVPYDVWQWLMGESDSFLPPDPLPGQLLQGRYWWRSELVRRINEVWEAK